MPKKIGLEAKRQSWVGGDGQVRVRVTVSMLGTDFEWMSKRKLSPSALLARVIHELQRKSPELDAEEEVRRWRSERDRAGPRGGLASAPALVR